MLVSTGVVKQHPTKKSGQNMVPMEKVEFPIPSAPRRPSAAKKRKPTSPWATPSHRCREGRSWYRNRWQPGKMGEIFRINPYKFMVIWRDFPYSNVLLIYWPLFFEGWLLLFLVWVVVFVFLVGGVGSIAYPSYMPLWASFWVTSQGKSLMDGRTHIYLTIYIISKFPEILSCGWFNHVFFCECSKFHNKLSPPGFSPRCFHWAWKTKKLRILNPQKIKALAWHVSFPNIRKVWQKQKPWKWPRWWFKYSWFSPLLGEMIQFDNHQVVMMFCFGGGVSLCAWHCFVSSVPYAPYTFLGRRLAQGSDKGG